VEWKRPDFQLLYGLWYKKRKEGGERRERGKGSASGVERKEGDA
jgi:hypothetical protein